MEQPRQCVMCEGLLISPLELTKESFRPTLTLERTLEMLSKGSSVSKFNPKILFNFLKSEEGSSICCSCSAILHTGLQVTSQILLLESRLRNLGARIRSSAAMPHKFDSKLEIKRSLRKNSHPDVSFSKPLFQSTRVEPPESRNETKHKHTENAAKKTSNVQSMEKNCQLILKSSEKPKKKNLSVKSTRTSPRGHKRSAGTSKLKSTPSLPPKQRRQHPPGVQHCPSCDFTVDVRSPSTSPSQTESPEILSQSVREALRKKSHRILVQHFMDSHLPTSVKENFERRKSDGVKTFFCPESTCPYKCHILRDLTRHFLGHHVNQPPPKPSLLTCPEKDCSSTFPVCQKSGRQDKNSLRYAQDNLAAHVYRHHDIPSHPSLRNSLVKNSKFALLADVVKENEVRKAYRCSRCDYENLLPKHNPRQRRQQYLSSRNAFLRHFYDAHLM